MEFNIDKQVLKILKYRIHYDDYKKVYKQAILMPETKLLVKAYGLYFKKYPEFSKIKFSGFWIFYKQLNSHAPKKFELLEPRVRNVMHKDVSEAELNAFRNKVLEVNVCTEAMNLLVQYDSGEEIDVIPTLYNIIEDAMTEQSKEDKTIYATLDVDSFLKLNNIEDGLTFMLNCLNKAIRPLRKGDHIILAARSDSGKSSFLLHLIAHVIPQLKNGDKVYYFGNEDLPEKLLGRLLSLFTDKSYEELSIDQDLIKDTLAIIREHVVFIGFHGKSTTAVEKELRNAKAGLIIFDILDQITFSKAIGNKVEDLEGLYIWARGMARYAPVISCCQADFTAEGEMYLGMHQLHYSKTGKQGTADAIIMLGRSADENMDNIRGITVPKNKLRMQSSPNQLREEVYFNKITGRFTD